MKKILTIILPTFLALGFCFGITGCNSDDLYDCDNHLHKWSTGKELVGKGNVETVVKYTCELCGKTATEPIDAIKNGVIYRLIGDSAEVCAYIGSETEVVIEPTYKGVPVARIGAEAFRYTNISKITLPDGVISIGEMAFEGCYYLQNIIIPKSVRYIEPYAFRSCKSLTEMIIPESVIYFGDGVFRFCNELRRVEFLGAKTDLRNYVFDDCEKLTDATLPKEISALGEQLFCGCNSLTYIKIPDSVTTIKKSAFVLCENLQTVVIGSGVQIIESNAFGGCESLKTIYYNGSAEDWARIINNSLDELMELNVEIYFYSSEKPIEEGKYWYSNEYGIPVKW